jgi:hypothetical protein
VNPFIKFFEFACVFNNHPPTKYWFSFLILYCIGIGLKQKVNFLRGGFNLTALRHTIYHDSILKVFSDYLSNTFALYILSENAHEFIMVDLNKELF